MAQDEYIFIVRCGEVALKGMNKPYFERMLLERIKKLLKKFDGVRAYRHEGLIYVRAEKVPGGEGQVSADPAAGQFFLDVDKCTGKFPDIQFLHIGD